MLGKAGAPWQAHGGDMFGNWSSEFCTIHVYEIISFVSEVCMGAGGIRRKGMVEGN